MLKAYSLFPPLEFLKVQKANMDYQAGLLRDTEYSIVHIFSIITK